jgi:hypothetical protein
MTLLYPGTQERVLSEATTGAGSKSCEGSIRSDSLVATLWVENIASGTLTVTVYTLTDTDKEVLLFTFPALTAPSVNLLLRKSGVSLQRFRVVASYTGACQFEVYVRAISGSGESSARILGAIDWRVSQGTVGTTPQVLIGSALTDRQGVLVKNWSATQTLYIAEASAKATIADGYPLAPRDALALDIAAGAEVWAVSDAPGADARLVESGG